MEFYFQFTDLTQIEAKCLFTPLDIERLHRYARSLVDFHIINDLVPCLGKLYFEKRLSQVRLNRTQQVSNCFCDLVSRMKIKHKIKVLFASVYNLI